MSYFHICKGCLQELCDEYGVGSDLGFVGDVMVAIVKSIDCDYRYKRNESTFAFEHRDITKPVAGLKYMKPHEAQI